MANEHQTHHSLRLTDPQLRAISHALSECLDGTDSAEQRAIFGDLRTAQAGKRILQRILQHPTSSPHPTPHGAAVPPNKKNG
jgi:pantothenate kinase